MQIDLKLLEARPMASRRLVLAPYAGAGASVFRGFPALLPPSIEPYALQLPGREDLGKLAPFTDWETMLAAAKVAVARLEPLPLAFFGHSLGALVALDLARATPPDRLAALFCAARPSPGAPAPDRAAFDGATSTDDFVARLVAAYGEAPASFSDPDIRDYALPILKADLQLLRSRRSERRPPLKAPLTIFAGAQDPVTKGDLSAWRAETTGPFDIVTIGAGHYFLETEKARIAAEISKRLDAL